MSSRKSSTIFILAAFLFSVLILTGCQNAETVNLTNQTPTTDDADTASFTVPEPDINLANPLVVSQRAEDVALCDAVKRKIDESAYANARWGVFAVSLKDGRVVCSLDGRKLFNPASIQKTLTAIVALDKLGADYRWRTEVYAANAIDTDGNLNGDLTLYGTGAPDFDAAAMENLVSQLQAKGLRRVKGNVIGDQSYFRGDNIGDGWTWNELQWWYGAEASALTFNDNQAFVNIENGTGRASTDYLNVTVGKPTPISSRANNNTPNYEAGGIKRGLEDNNFYVWGNTKSFGARVAVSNPAGLAAKNFKEALEKKGIAVEGAVNTRDWKSENQIDPANSALLASVESKTLGEIVRKMNKNSVNLYAELILRTIGKKFSDEVPDGIQLPQNVRGDDITGAALVKKWLLQHNIAAGEVEIHDGSGLSRLDFVTPESFAKAFIFAAQSPYAQIFTDSLPVAATDGTLGGRLARVKGKVLAKTGTITFVNSLAGYAQSNAGGEVLTFAVITNNDTRKNGAVSMIDVITTMLVTGKDEKDLKDSANQNTANKSANANSDENKPNFVIQQQGKR